MYRIAASTVEMGDPLTAARGIADIIAFILGQVPQSKRRDYLRNLQYKIWELNTAEIASKKTTEGAAIGQAITFVKTILRGHHPAYIREVLRNLVIQLSRYASY